jgi:predicted dehydrogenase
MIEAARKYGRVVQVGAQNRSSDNCYEALEYLKNPDFGDIHFVKVFNSKQRVDIGRKPDTETPPGVDYDMWLGPAPLRPFNENHFHYAWHWFWVYSGGDIINDGIHQIDIARWAIGRKYPKAVVSGGGINFFKDDQETPDTHTVTWEYDDGLTMAFEQVLWAPYMQKTPLETRDTDGIPNWPFNGTRIEIYGTNQIMFLGRHGDGFQVFDKDGKSVVERPGRFTHRRTRRTSRTSSTASARARTRTPTSKSCTSRRSSRTTATLPTGRAAACGSTRKRRVSSTTPRRMPS